MCTRQLWVSWLMLCSCTAAPVCCSFRPQNIRRGPNYRLLGKTILGWIFTIAITGLLSACFFSMGESPFTVHGLCKSLCRPSSLAIAVPSTRVAV